MSSLPGPERDRQRGLAREIFTRIGADGELQRLDQKSEDAKPKETV